MNRALKILLKHFEVEVRISRRMGFYLVDCVVGDDVITSGEDKRLRFAMNDAACQFLLKQGIGQAEMSRLGKAMNKACKFP